MRCRYRSIDIVHRIGANPVMRIEVELDFRDHFKQDFPLLVLSPRYTIELYEVSKDLSVRGPRGLVDRVVGESLFLSNPVSRTVRTHIDVPVSQELVNMINEIKRLDKLPAFNILVECLGVFYEFGSSPRPYYLTTYVTKPVYGREETLVVFTSDEVDLLMRKLRYVEVLRVEMPLPLKVEHVAQEKLARSVREVMTAKELLMKGEYGEVLRTCRNVIMNYLTKKEDRKKLAEDIAEYVLSKVPETLKNLYNSVLDSIGETLHGLLQHLHKFIKEDTGRLVANPLRADAEYAFYILFSIVKYLAELSMEG